MKDWLGSTGGTGREVFWTGGTVRDVRSVVMVDMSGMPVSMETVEAEVVLGMVVVSETSVPVTRVVLVVGAETVTVSLPGIVTTEEEESPRSMMELELRLLTEVVSVSGPVTVVPGGVAVETVSGVTVVVGGTKTVVGVISVGVDWALTPAMRATPAARKRRGAIFLAKGRNLCVPETRDW